MSKDASSGRHFEILALAVASGSTIRAAAASCKASERVAYRTASSPEFRQRVSELRSEMTNNAVGLLSAAATEAVACIRQLLDEENVPAVRLNAAKAILNALGPLSELGELRARLDALESGR